MSLRRRRIIGPSFPYLVTQVAAAGPGPGTFTGPGDIVAFDHWWGLRAYSDAQLAGTTPALDLVHSADGIANSTTFNIAATGKLADLTTHANWPDVAASNLYDQAGSLNLDIRLGGVGAAPVVVLSASGLSTASGGPALTFTNGLGKNLTANIPAGISQPFCVSLIFIQTGDFSLQTCMFSFGDASFAGVYTDVTLYPTVRLHPYAGHADELPYTGNTWYVVNVLFAGSASKALVNGTLYTGKDYGTADIVTGASERYVLGLNWSIGSSSSLTGMIIEAGIVSGDQSAHFADIEANQRAFWGI